MSEQDQLSQYLREQKIAEQGETLTVLDALRRSRKSRGGTGEPLRVPPNLADAARGQGIVITDADINDPAFKSENGQ